MLLKEFEKNSMTTPDLPFETDDLESNYLKDNSQKKKNLCGGDLGNMHVGFAL